MGVTGKLSLGKYEGEIFNVLTDKTLQKNLALSAIAASEMLETTATVPAMELEFV